MTRINPRIQTICRDCGHSPCFQKWHEFNVDILFSDLLVSKSAIVRATQDWFNGKGSKMGSLPLDLWALDDGRKLLVDGYHRLSKLLMQGKTSFGHRVVGQGYSDYWAVPSNDDVFEFRPDLPHGGLELLFPTRSLARFVKMRRWKTMKKNPPRTNKVCPCGKKGTKKLEGSDGDYWFCAPHYKKVIQEINKSRKAVDAVEGGPFTSLPLEERKARSTGAMVSLYAEGDPDDNSGNSKYCTVCDTHGNLVYHNTKANAIYYLSHPEEWCDDCRGSV